MSGENSQAQYRKKNPKHDIAFDLFRQAEVVMGSDWGAAVLLRYAASIADNERLMRSAGQCGSVIPANSETFTGQDPC